MAIFKSVYTCIFYFFKIKVKYLKKKKINIKYIYYTEVIKKNVLIKLLIYIASKKIYY